MPEDTNPDALPRGYRLHWYVLERVLGQGGFGITYLAQDTNLHRQVAIKEYLPGDVAQRTHDASVRPRTEALGERYRWGLDRFIGEGQTLAHFDHPNIVRVLAVFEANGTAYMVMRFEDGENLGRLLERRGTLSEPELTGILLPILDGLELVHGARFIHRDIKPENIHIRRDGTPVLLDFGSARQYMHRTHTMTILVARGYAPLEQYSGGADSQGAWSDIYSLAATCYRAIAGTPPADALERVKGVLGSVREILAPAREVGRGRYSERLLAAIDHGMELREKDRPQSVHEWRREVLPATPAGGATVAGTASVPPTVVPPDAPGAPRRGTFDIWLRRGAMAAAVALAVIAGMQVQHAIDERARQERARLEEELRVRQAELRSREDEVTAREAERTRPAQEALRQAAEPEPARRLAAASPVPPPVAPVPAPKPTPAEPAKPAGAKTEVARSEVQPPAAEPRPSVALMSPPASAPQAREVVPPAPAPDRDPGPVAKSNVVEPPAKAPASDVLEAAEAAIQRGEFATAVPIVKQLAAAGDARGQTLLGRLNETGLGMPRNALGAYMWYSLAARGGNTAAAKMRERVASGLQPAEIRQADRAVDGWRPRRD